MNIIYFVPNITIAGGIFRIVSDKMNYLAENMEGRLFLAYYGNGQEKPIYPLHPNIQLLPIDIEWKVGFGKKINRVWKNISIIRHIFKKDRYCCQCQCSFIDMDITIYLSADKEDP